jgi:predicted ATPase/transcriptional regulator with XRE-family HTH domain
VEEESIPFGLLLKRQRRARDLTQEELAQQLGCASVTLHKIETGERRPSKQILERLAAILSLPPAEQPAFMAYARAVYPGGAPPPGGAAPEAPGSAPWRRPDVHARNDNLPLQLTTLIGREREIVEVGSLLGTTRLLTVTGSGGAGKTRLSLEVAAEALDTFKDGVWFVALAPLSDPGLIPDTVAEVLGLRNEQGRPLIETLLAHLHGKQLLLILDNCEHLIEDCARFADAVLRTGREVRILATSREALGIAGERTWRVPSLPAPDPRAALPVEQIEQYAAVQLFIARATYVLPGFQVTNANAPALAQVCWRLDGIPLAIELAAARVRALSVEQIAARLDDRFRLLTEGGRTALPRQQTLRATLDWSYDLLTDPERILFRRLAVFADGWRLDAAEAVCADVTLPDPGPVRDGVSGLTTQVPARRGSGEESLLDAADVLDLLCRLVDKSLVTAEPLGGETRYRMLETIREYALEKLREAGEVEAVRGRHYRCFFLAASSVDNTSVRRHREFDRLEVEHDNLRAALGWVLDRDESEMALAFCNALAPFWGNRGHWTEGRMWHGRAIAASRRAQAGQEVSREHRSRYGKALDSYGFMAAEQGDYVVAQEALEEALAVARELDDKADVATVLDSLGTLAHFRDDAQAARRHWEESLALWREYGDKNDVAEGLRMLAMGARERGDYGESESLSRESVATHRELGNKLGLAAALDNLVWLAMIAGDYAAGQAFVDESLALRQEANSTAWLPLSFTQFGYLAWRRGDLPAARESLQQALALYRRMEASSFDTCPCLTGCAAVDVSDGRLARGVSLLGAVAAEGERTGRYNKDIILRVYNQTLAAAQAQMDPQAFDAAWAAGRALTMAQAMELASES